MSEELKKALVFAILMQRVEGKSPAYMLEKWRSVQSVVNPVDLLDVENRGKYRNWFRKWGLVEADMP